MFTMDEIISFIVVALAVGGIVVLKWYGKKLTEDMSKRARPDPGEPDDCLEDLEINPRTLDDVERALDFRRRQFERYMDGKWKPQDTMEGGWKLKDTTELRGITGDENTPTVEISRCPYCKRKVEEDKGSCPGCGAPY